MVYGFEGQLKQNRSVISKMFSPSFHSQLPHFHEAYYTGYKYLMASFLAPSKTTTGLPAVELCQAFNWILPLSGVQPSVDFECLEFSDIPLLLSSSPPYEQWPPLSNELGTAPAVAILSSALGSENQTTAI